MSERHPDYERVMQEPPRPGWDDQPKPRGVPIGDVFSFRGDTPREVTSETPRPAARQHRTRSDEEKTQILAEYNAAPFGTKSKVLEQHHITHAHISGWAKARDAGRLAITTRTGPPAINPQDLIYSGPRPP